MGWRKPSRKIRCTTAVNAAGPFPRLRHAVISTLTGRRGEDGHRVFSFSALAAPYAGSMTAVYGWYPDRFGAKDAFRMGNYSLLGYMGGNIALEFFYSGPHSLLSRMHLNNAHGSPDSRTEPMSGRGFTAVAGISPPLPARQTVRHVLRCKLRHEAVQRVFRVVWQPGHLFLASSAGRGDAAV